MAIVDNKIRVADYIAKFVVARGVKHVFMLTGGGAMHLNDAFGREKKLELVFNHHEQACAIAGEGYARVCGTPAVVCVTSGPGGTNALTGVLGEWLDSIPAVYLSGQVRYDVTIRSTSLPLRQLGDQEGNIVDIVRPITKYVEMVTDPNSIRYHLEKAFYLAATGRPGPVWLDIPLNIQSAFVDVDQLPGYTPVDDQYSYNFETVKAQIDDLLDHLKTCKRPLILAGSAVRLAGAVQELCKLAEKTGIPVQVAWNAIDLFPSDHPLYAGRPGTLGQRAGNLIFQNCDLLINIGCRLNLRQIGYSSQSIARAAYKVSVDIDPAELKKQTILIDLPIHCDAKEFITWLENKITDLTLPDFRDWIGWCKARLDKFPAVLPEYYAVDEPVNPYVFSTALSDQLHEDDIVVSSNGSSCVIPIQVMNIKKGQRHIVNSGCAAMGYGLPAAIGACFANQQKRVICLEGDGSLQLNIQELQTIVHHKLPVKIFVYNNNGYLSIRTTQTNFFKGNLVGESPSSGVSFPDMVKIAQAYGIETDRIKMHSEMTDQIAKALDTPGPYLCDVVVDPAQGFSPRIVSKRMPDGRMVSPPLEDMYPFLDRDDLQANMIIPLFDE